MRTFVLLPALAVAAFAGIVLALFGVSPGPMAALLGYVAAFQIVPGVAAFAALTRPERLGLRELGIGWGLGYALEVLAFALTAGLDVRGLFVLYPVVVTVAALPRLAPRLRALANALAAPAAGWHWGLALVACGAIGSLADAFFTVSPLPWDLGAAGVRYDPDVVWHIGAAAEALHHWPLQVPSLAGERLHYHYFANVEAAAIAQVTGLSPGLVLLRLATLPLIVLATVQLAVLTRTLGGPPWAGVVAAALFLVVGVSDPLPATPSTFLTTFPLSPSFAYGLVVFLPLLTLLAERLRAAGAGGPGTVVVALALAAACAGGKATILPVLGGAIAVCVLLGKGTRLPALPVRLLLWAGTATVAVWLVFDFAMYGNQRSSFAISPWKLFVEAQPFALLMDELETSPLVLLVAPVAVVLGTLKLLFVLLPGLAVLFRRRAVDGPRALVLATLAVGLGPLYLVDHPGDSQLYFFYYGYAAAAALSAVGLTTLVGSRRLPAFPAAGLAALVAAVWLVEAPGMGSRASYRALAGEITYPTGDATLTPALYGGLRWVEANTDPDDVFAVAKRPEGFGRPGQPNCVYTAFAERRALIECSYDGSASAFGVLGGDRTRERLNEGIFAGRRESLDLARARHGVRFLLIDETRRVSPAARRLGRVVFSNRALTVVDVR